jgi:hypothetical protein
MFDERVARRDLRRYRRQGLDRAGRRLVDMVRDRGIESKTVLEIGGGIGAPQLELLRAGAARTTNVEISPSYEQAARELLEEGALADRVERLFGDIVEQPGLAPEADVVLLNRVVCCYPDADALMSAVSERARSAIVLSFPPDVWIARLIIAAANLYQRLRGRAFRGYVHPESSILAPALRHGFRVEETGRAGIWRVVGLVR